MRRHYRINAIRENIAAVDSLLQLTFLSAGTRSELLTYRDELIEQIWDWLRAQQAGDSTSAAAD